MKTQHSDPWIVPKLRSKPPLEESELVAQLRRPRTTMTTKPMNVIVIGGSLGGLFAGVVLKRLGHKVRIFERNPTPLLHNQGAGIVVGGQMQAFFEEYDVNQRRINVTSPIRHYLDRHGTEIDQEEWEQNMTSWDLVYHLLRSMFDRVDSDYCDLPPLQDGEGEGTYEYGKTVTGLRDTGSDGIEVSYRLVGGQNGSALANLVIGADGPSSIVRKMLEPDVERRYAGYVAWRGTCPEVSASVSAQEAFVNRFTFYHRAGIQALAYLIPGKNGNLEKGKRLINWVWYCNYETESQELEDLMTDKDGKRHNITLPVGMMADRVWEKQKAYAHDILPPQFAEIISKTEQPFIQAITDVISSRVSYFDGRVLLLGDAVAGFRPHTAASTNQAAYNALALGQMLRGELSRDEWEYGVMRYAIETQKHGVQMGQRSQFGEHPLAS